MLAEFSETGIVAVVASVSAALMGAYALFRRTRRNEDSADAEQARKELEADASLWRRQYEEKCKSDERFNVRMEDQYTDLYGKFQTLESLHQECIKEHALARAEWQSAKFRIAELERLLGKT